MQRAFELIAFERLAPGVLLDDNQFAQLNALERRESSAAGGTVAASADGGVVLARPAVLHLGIIVSAKRASHR
jgi:hypothetical protein